MLIELFIKFRAPFYEPIMAIFFSTSKNSMGDDYGYNEGKMEQNTLPNTIIAQNPAPVGCNEPEKCTPHNKQHNHEVCL